MLSNVLPAKKGFYIFFDWNGIECDAIVDEEGKVSHPASNQMNAEIPDHDLPKVKKGLEEWIKNNK